MKILNFNNCSPEGLMIEGQTIMIMCFTPKIILFENSKELKDFLNVWEVINDIVCDNDILLEEIGDHISGCFLEAFEQEINMLEAKKHNKRKFILKDISDMDDTNFEDCITIKLGIFKYKDMWINMEELSKLVFLLESLLFNERSFPMKKEDSQMFLKIIDIWKEDLNLSKDEKFFKVEVEEI